MYNLVGRDHPTRNFSLKQVHEDGPARIARICAEEGVPRLIHLSALGASADSKSAFLAAKAAGEAAVRAAFPSATIVRPGWMFGFEDRFLNMIASFTSEWPRKFLLGRHPVTDAVVHPIYVGDVARALQKIAHVDGLEGRDVELIG